MRYVSARLRVPPDAESSGRVGARTSTEAMRYVSARLRVPPDVEASGTCRSEDFSTEAMSYVLARLMLLLMWRLQVCVGARTPRPKR